MEKDVMLDNFISHNFKPYHMPIITIYKNTSDYPNIYVARLFDLNKRTKFITKSHTLDKIRQKIPEHFCKIDRNIVDDICIIEIYI